MRPLHFLFVPALLWSVAPAGAQAIPRPTPPMRYPLKIDRAGLDSSSLRQFELCAAALSEELGVKPSSSTVALLQQIKSNQIADDLPLTAPATGSL